MDIEDLTPLPVSNKRADVKERSPAGIEWERKLKNMEEVKRVDKKCDMGSGVKENKEVAAVRKIEIYQPGWYIGSCAKMEARRGRERCSRSRIKRYSPYEWNGRNGNRRRSSRSSSRSRRWSSRNRKSSSRSRRMSSRSSSRTRRSSRSSSRNRGMSSRNRRETRSSSWNSESRNRRRNTRSRSRSPKNSRNCIHRSRNNINRGRNSRSKSRSWGRNSRNRSTSRDRNKRRNSRSRNGIRRSRCRRSRSRSFGRSNSRSRSRYSRSRSRNSISREKNEGRDISLSRNRINGSIESNRINSRSSKSSSLERNEGISSSSSSSSSASLDIGIRKIEPGETQSYREEEKRREGKKGESCDTKACYKRNLELMMEGGDVKGKVLEEELGVMMEGCDEAQGCDKAGVVVFEEGLEIKMGREVVERKEVDVKGERNDRIMYDKKMPKGMEVEKNSSMNIFSIEEKESVEKSRYQWDERFIPLQEISSCEEDFMKQICDIRSFSPLKFVGVKQKRGCEVNNDGEEKNINKVTIGRKGATAKDLNMGDKKCSQENRMVGSGVEKKIESVAEKERMSHCLKEESKQNRNVEKDGWDIEREYTRNIEGEYNMDIKSYNARNKEREFTRDIEREDTLYIERDNTRYKEREGTRDDTRYREREGTRDTLYRDRKDDRNYIRFREREGTRYKYREENNDFFKYKEREGTRDNLQYKHRKDARDNSRYTEREDTRDDIKYKESKRTMDKELILSMDKERNDRGGGRVASRIENRTLTDGVSLNEEKAERRREKLGGTFRSNTRPQNWFREEGRTITTKIENHTHTTEDNHPSTTKENHTSITMKNPTSMTKEENLTIEKSSSNNAKELRLEKPLDPPLTLSRSPYLPPARLKMSRISDKSSAAFQRRSWEALKKNITGLVNKVNTSNLSVVLRELFRKNVIRGKGLLCQALLRAQSLNPTSSSTHVLAAFVAGINCKFPQIGELLLHRLLLQICRGMRSRGDDSCFAPCRFLAQLVNQRVAHEMVAMETIKLLLEKVKKNLERGESWRDSVELALAFLKECGSKLREVAPNGLVVVMATIRNILQNNSFFKYVLEDLMKEDFKDFPSLLMEEDQLTHLVEVEGHLLEEENLNEFKEDLNYLENEAKYKQLRASVLGQNSEYGEDSGSEGDTEDSDLEDQNGKEVKEDQNDVVAKQDQKDRVTKEDQKDIVAKEDQKDIVTKEDQKDIVTKEDQKDIVTKEDQKDVVSMEDLVSKKVKEDQKDLVAKDAQKDLVSKGDQMAKEDQVEENQDDVAAKKGQVAEETKESQEDKKDVAAKEAQVAMHAKVHQKDAASKENPRVAPPSSDLLLDHTSLKSFRRSVYLTMQSSSDVDECVLKLKEEVRAGFEGELCHLILDCCAQQRDFVRFYCLLAQRFCKGNRHYQKPFETIFGDAFDTCHRLQTEELLNVAKFFSHLLSCDVISWRVLAGLRLGHASTTRSSHLFVRVLFEELTASLGLSELKDRLRQPPLFPALESLLPREDSAPFFASVGLGDIVRSQPKPTAVVAPVSHAQKESSGSSTSSGSSSSSSSSSTSSSSSSTSSSSSDSSDDERPSKKMRPSCEARSSSSSSSSSSSGSSSSSSSSSDSSSSDESSSDKSEEKGSCKNSESSRLAGGATTEVIAAGSCKRKKLSSRRVRDDMGKDPSKALSPFAQKKGGEERAGLVPSVEVLEG